MNQNFENELYKIAGDSNVRKQEPMAKHTTFRIGGPAQYYVMPETVEELGQLMLLCRAEKVPFFILGQGSNLLVRDGGIAGAVIQLGERFSGYQVRENRIYAQAGILLSRLGAAARDAGLAGIEFAAGIPGTLGGGIVMNAGAYGGELKDVVTEVQLMDYNGDLHKKSGEEMQFAYRHSLVQDQPMIVLGATLELKEGDRAEIGKRMEELSIARRTKQPLEYPSAGSTFKRPEGYFAGKLIMDAGLRGYQVGGAQVSEKHCGFVVNRGNATASDVLALMEDVSEKVQEKFQVKLEPEVRVVGEPL